eukprot:4173687-Pyramimonas_sp.AAC.1
MPSRDPLAIATGAWPRPLCEVTGNVDGFADALVVLRRHARREMYQLGFVSHGLDAMCFLKCDKDRLVAVVLWATCLQSLPRSFSIFPSWRRPSRGGRWTSYPPSSAGAARGLTSARTDA